ncbi:MAG TPA: hypothetical protein VKT00_11460 [Casimicrobiaceae bacterium]|nr:hypothetical protein [Casimicrobiaceae bacterium]
MLVPGGETWGSGYDQARHLLEGAAPPSPRYAATKWTAMVVSYMAGTPDGLFTPPPYEALATKNYFPRSR